MVSPQYVTINWSSSLVLHISSLGDKALLRPRLALNSLQSVAERDLELFIVLCEPLKY